MSEITIYHNPRCSTSRNTLAMIRNSGETPIIVEYLKTPPSRALLVELIAAAGLGVRGGVVCARESGIHLKGGYPMSSRMRASPGSARTGLRR